MTYDQLSQEIDDRLDKLSALSPGWKRVVTWSRRGVVDTSDDILSTLEQLAHDLEEIERGRP